MGLDVKRELAALRSMTVPELGARYAEVFREPCRSRHKPHLVKRIIWRMQANEEGDLSERARRRAEELANDTDLRLTPPKARPVSHTGGPTARGHVARPSDPRLPMPGTVLTRRYKGRTVLATVLEGGVEYDGQVYRSLSAVAKAVTGSHWNGLLFFNLTGKEAARP
jgi:hypothetical protein